MLQTVHITRVGLSVVLSHGGQQHGFDWSQAEAIYLAGKRLVADAAEYDRTDVWTESLPEPPIAEVEFRRMGLMVHLLVAGREFVAAPYAQMRQILKGVYSLAKQIEADVPAIALAQIGDMAVLYASAVPLGLSSDRRKIDEALKMTPGGIPPLGIVPPPTVIGGVP